MSLGVDPPTVRTGEIGKRGGVALAISIPVNVAVLWTVITLDLTASTAAFDYPSAVVLTAVGVVGATAVYWLLARRSATPDETFVRVAVVVLLLSFLPNVALYASGGATLGEVVTLMSLHLPPAAACIASLTGRLSGRRR